MLLDEATASDRPDDQRTGDPGRSRELVKDRTLIVVAHRLATIRSADQILVMHDGRIVERTHAELLAAGGRYTELWHQRSAPTGAGGP